MNNKIAEIKEAYEKATNKGKWLDNGNEFVAENNQRCGIGGFITYEDSALVSLLITEVPNLLDELEKAQTKLDEQHDEFYNEVRIARQDVDTLRFEIKQLRTAMGRLQDDRDYHANRAAEASRKNTTIKLVP